MRIFFTLKGYETSKGRELYLCNAELTSPEPEQAEIVAEEDATDIAVACVVLLMYHPTRLRETGGEPSTRVPHNLEQFLTLSPTYEMDLVENWFPLHSSESYGAPRRSYAQVSGCLFGWAPRRWQAKEAAVSGDQSPTANTVMAATGKTPEQSVAKEMVRTNTVDPKARPGSSASLHYESPPGTFCSPHQRCSSCCHSHHVQLSIDMERDHGH